MHQQKAPGFAAIFTVVFVLTTAASPVTASIDTRFSNPLDMARDHGQKFLSGGHRLVYEDADQSASSDVEDQANRPNEARLVRRMKARTFGRRLHRKVRPTLKKRAIGKIRPRGSGKSAISPSDVLFDIVGSGISTPNPPPQQPPQPPPQHDDDCMSCAD